MPKLQQTKEGQYLLCIPRELARAKKWSKGKELILAFIERWNVELREIEVKP
jgi:hypothetical protein